MAVAPPAPVVESGARPAQPIATSAWPSRQGRPKLSAIITAGARRRRPRAISAADPPRGRVGVGGQQRDRPSSRLEESIPAFAQTQPALRLGDQHPGVGADDARALREHQLDQRRVLVDARRPSSPGLARRARPRRQPPDPPLGLRDDLLGDDDDLVAAGSSRPPAIRRAELALPRCSSGRPVERPDPQLARSSGSRSRRYAAAALRAVAELPEDLGRRAGGLRIEQQAVAQQRVVLGRVEVESQRVRAPRGRS